MRRPRIGRPARSGAAAETLPNRQIILNQKKKVVTQLDDEGHMEQGDTTSGCKKGAHLELSTPELEESSSGLPSFYS